MSYEFVFDGWMKASREAKRQKAGCYKLSTGFYDEKTKRITLNLDVLLETVCYDCGGWCKKEKERCVTELTKRFSQVVTHEHLHDILARLDDDELESWTDKLDHIDSLTASYMNGSL